MIIANPIYDTTFKKLMENERLAKFFIGTLLEQTIVSLEMNPQEFTYKLDDTKNIPSGGKKKSSVPDLRGFSFLRVDYIATILTETGEHKRILIEVQKAWEQDDLTRFRTYLAEQYRKIDTVNGVKVILPITTIYVLDSNLPKIDSACIKVERGYRDMITRLPVTAKSPFIEKLTHDSYVVQTRRITSDRYQTRLDKLLSVFEQAHFVDNAEMTKMYNYLPDDEDVKEMIDLLHYVGTDPAERKILEMEQEAHRTWTDSFAKVNRALEEKEKALDEKDKALEAKDKALDENKKALEEKDKVIEDLVKSKTEDKKVIEDLVKSNEEQAIAIDAIKRQLDEMQHRSSR
jgi:hypothetical protein